MKFTPITVYKRNGGIWENRVMERARVRFVRKTGTDSAGRHITSELCARIFDSGASELSLGDKIIAGRSEAAVPQNALTVCEISDNTNAVCGHFRITAR